MVQQTIKKIKVIKKKFENNLKQTKFMLTI